MKRLILVFLIFTLLGFAAAASAQSLTNAQKVLLVVQGVDQYGNAVDLPAGTAVTWETILPNPRDIAHWADATAWDVVTDRADFARQEASSQQVAGWWFIPKGPAGVVRIRLTVKLAGAAAALPSATTDVTILAGMPPVTVMIGFAGAPVIK
jgi:hypothetical protein